MTIPSKDTLIKAFGDDIGDRLYGVLKGYTKPEEFPSVRAWVAQCYHEPDYADQKLYACNEIMGGFGVEGMASDDGRDGVSYINMGDTYDATILLYGDRFRVTTWGDWVESPVGQRLTGGR